MTIDEGNGNMKTQQSDGTSPKFNYYYPAGAAFIGIFLLIYATQSRVQLISLILGVSLIVRGLLLRFKLKGGESTRDYLMASSFACPGYVQFTQMGKRFTGVFMMLCFYASVSAFLSAVTGVINIDSVDVALFVGLMVYGILFTFYIAIMCALQINDYCNEKDMPFIGGEFEMKWTNTALGYGITTAIAGFLAGVFGVLIAVYLRVSLWIPRRK